MTEAYFLDTNVLIYGFDQSDSRKRGIAQQLIDQLLVDSAYFVSLQVLNEFSHIARKKIIPALSWTDIHDFIDLIPNSQILTPDKTIILKALQIAETHEFSYWDSLIMATASACNCRFLLSEDWTNGQVIDGVKVKNPFLTAL